jgi:hypothetical protein
MTFLPKDYEVPVTPSNYMKLVDGENRFRILGDAVVGFEYFTDKDKPVRSKEMFEETPNIKKDGKVKEFWAFPVFEYKSQGVRILELTQKTIMAPIKAYVDNAKWGDPTKYDLCVTKSGEGLDTTYQTMAEPPIGEPDDMIKNELAETPINLEALFDGGDPFKTK